MPPVSRKQARFLRSVAEGDAKAPGLSRGEAKEMVSGYPTKDLPEKKKPTKKKARRKVKTLPYPKKD